ncbi:NAD(P)-dependent oxidoreductase, partial [uncultured Sulfitobacter sp.]|uniref:NAD(P)-dependent oxidoreductase n=1 Tax=uncultured Sulfitobacter sp. TaxID=191468 RepID=UPI0025989337
MDTEVAIVANPDPEQLQNMPNLKWVQSLWAGVENLVHTLPDEVAVVRMTDPQLAKTMAEAVLTMTLYLHRDLPKYAEQQLDAVWEQHTLTLPEDRIVGILGLGALGRAACGTLSLNGFDVLGWSRSLRSIPDVRCYFGDDGLAELLSIADIVVILLPLTNETKGLLDKSRLS